MESPKTITIDEVEHQVADLGPKIQALVDIHTGWREELQKARLEVAKLEAAIRSLESEVLNETKKVLEEQALQAQAAANPVEDTAVE